MSMVIVKNFRVSTVENNLSRAACTISDETNETELWFEVSGVPEHYRLDTADAFLAPGLLFALKRGSGIRFEVPISDALAQKSHDTAFVFGTQLGYEKRPEIECPQTVTIERKSRGGITGFSAGVDSWFAFQDKFLKCSHPSKKLSHILVNDVGANATEKKKGQVLDLAREVAVEHDLGLICIASNASSFLEMNFQKTHTARNASAAHLLSPICDVFYYSSTDTYAEAGVFPTYDMAYADTIILPLLSSDAITLLSTGSAFSRAEKTGAILDIPHIGERLDVCVNHRHGGTKINCGYCWKCLRTELTLEAFGALRKFEPVFDLDAYRESRRSYIGRAALSCKPTEREAFELAIQSNIAGPRLLVKAWAVLTKALKDKKTWSFA